MLAYAGKLEEQIGGTEAEQDAFLEPVDRL